MARALYTVRIWSMPAQASSGLVSGPVVPSGFIWVVRDVRMVNEQPQAGLHVGTLVLSGTTGGPIASTPTFFSLVGELYRWEGRAVLETGEQIQASSDSSGWALVVDGYQLTVT